MPRPLFSILHPLSSILVFSSLALAQPTTQPSFPQPTTAPTTSPSLPPADPGIDKAYLQSHFTKSDHQIPMRDGVTLHTAVYVPNNNPGRHFPVLFLRTPYGIGKEGFDQFPEPKAEVKWLARDGFIFVLQDVRGRWGSQGTFVHSRPLGLSVADERTDAWDSIDWIVRHVPESSGRVALVGTSYPGFYAACGAIEPHPALKCAVPAAPLADWYVGDDIHRNGAFNLAATYNYLRFFGVNDKPAPTTIPSPDGYQYFMSLGSPSSVQHLDPPVNFWDECLAHPDYDDYWKSKSFLPHLKNIPIPILTVGGWYDAEDLYGTLESFHAITRNNPKIPTHLVMGPWSHGQWNRPSGESLGDVHFGSHTAEFYRRQIELPFLKQYLEPGTPELPLARATSFDTGSHTWKFFNEWPPALTEPRTLYVHSNGALTPDAPSAAEAPDDEFLSDPSHPVPFYGHITLPVAKEYMTADQRFASARPDVLTYRTPALDQPVTLAGPVTAILNVSTTGTDSDWIIKLIDVYPDDTPDPSPNPASVKLGGYQQLLRLDILPARYRVTLEHPIATTPNEIITLTLTTPDIHHTFLPNHRLMVQVQSTCFPLFARNPQTFSANPLTAPITTYTKSTHHLHHTPAHPSQLKLPILPPTP